MIDEKFLIIFSIGVGIWALCGLIKFILECCIESKREETEEEKMDNEIFLLRQKLEREQLKKELRELTEKNKEFEEWEEKEK